MAVYSITLSRQGGTGSPAALYYDSELAVFYLTAPDTPITAITPPTRAGYKFLGFWTQKDSGGEKYIFTSGRIADAFNGFAASDEIGNMTLYARWKAETYTLSFDACGGTLSGSSKISVAFGSAIGTLPTVSLSGYSFKGWYVDDAEISANSVWNVTGNATAYPLWSSKSKWYEIVFDGNGGTLNSPSPLYFHDDDIGVGWYTKKNSSLDSEISRISIPTRNGWTFEGFRAGGKTYCDRDGKLNLGIRDSMFLKVKAEWNPEYQTVELDQGKGVGGTEEIYHVNGTFYAERTCETIIDSIAPPSAFGIFLGYWYGDTKVIDENGRITGLANIAITDDIALSAQYLAIGGLTDYFELGSNALGCIESADGCVMSIVETSHDGTLAIQAADSPVAAHKIYGRQLNPVVTYRVVGCGRVSLTLGKAHGQAVRSAKKITIDGVSRYVVETSGYMLTAFEFRTGADKIPTLTLFGTANEGYMYDSAGNIKPAFTDAINKWTVEFDVCPDHVSQDVFGAINGGGELVDCTIRGECSAVVPLEYGMPCASDVVRGKIIVSAKTAAYGGEDEPTARAPFLAVQVNESNSDIDFTSYNIRAERSLN